MSQLYVTVDLLKGKRLQIRTDETCGVIVSFMNKKLFTEVIFHVDIFWLVTPCSVVVR